MHPDEFFTGEARMIRRGEHMGPSAYDDNRQPFRKRFPPGSAEDMRQREAELQGGMSQVDRFRATGARARALQSRIEKLDSALQKRLDTLQRSRSSRPVYELGKAMDAETKAQHELDAYRNRLGAVIVQFRTSLNGVNGGDLRQFREMVERREQILIEADHILREYETKAGILSPPPVRTVMETRTSPVPLPERAERKGPWENVYPYGWRGSQGLSERPNSIIISFSTGWGHRQQALRALAGNQGAENLGQPQSILINNIQGRDPLSQYGTEREFGAGYREAHATEAHRRALEEAGIEVEQTPDGTRIRVTYVPEGEYVEINGEKIPGPIGHRPEAGTETEQIPTERTLSQGEYRTRYDRVNKRMYRELKQPDGTYVRDETYRGKTVDEIRAGMAKGDYSVANMPSWQRGAETTIGVSPKQAAARPSSAAEKKGSKSDKPKAKTKPQAKKKLPPVPAPAVSGKPTPSVPVTPSAAPGVSPKTPKTVKAPAEKTAAPKTKPAKPPDSKPVKKPASKPEAKPEPKPAEKPVAKVEPAAKPAAKPAESSVGTKGISDMFSKPEAKPAASAEKPAEAKPAAPAEKPTGSQMLERFDKLDLANKQPTSEELNIFELDLTNAKMTEDERNVLYDKGYAVQQKFEGKKKKPAQAVQKFLDRMLVNDFRGVGTSKQTAVSKEATKKHAEAKPSTPQSAPNPLEQAPVDPELGNRVMTQLERSFKEAKLSSIKLKQVQVKTDGTVLLFGEGSEADIKKCSANAQTALNSYMEERQGKDPDGDLIKWPNSFTAPRVDTSNMKAIPEAKPAKASETNAKPAGMKTEKTKPQANPETAQPKPQTVEKTDPFAISPEEKKMFGEVTAAVKEVNGARKLEVAFSGSDQIFLANAGSTNGLLLKKEGDSWMIMRHSDRESGLYSNLSAELSSLQEEPDLKEFAPVLTRLLFKKREYTEAQEKDERKKTQDALTQLAQEKKVSAIWLYSNDHYENFEAIRMFTHSNLEKILGELDPKYLNVLKQLPLTIGTAYREVRIVTVNGQRYLSLPCSLPAADMKKSLEELLQREIVRQKLDEDLNTLVPGVTIFLWDNVQYKDHEAIERSKASLQQAIGPLSEEEKKALPSIVIEENPSAVGLQITGKNQFGVRGKVIVLHPEQTSEQMKETLTKGVQEYASSENLSRNLLPQLTKELKLNKNQGIFVWSDRIYKDYPAVERSLDTIRNAVALLVDTEREALKESSMIISDVESSLGVQKTSQGEKVIVIGIGQTKEQMAETIKKALKQLKKIPVQEDAKSEEKPEAQILDLGDGLEAPYRLIRSGAQGGDETISRAVDALLPKIDDVRRVKQADLTQFVQEIDNQINNNKKLTDGTREKLKELKQALK